MPGIIGTAGHVDHGKSSLILALTNIDPDRLPEEKARGMTIDLGFAHLSGPDGQVVSIVDVPGHESLVTNMVSGAMGVQVCVLCIAADDGVMNQTREHVQILASLPVEHLIVALTKCDLVTDDILSDRKKEIDEFLSEFRFGGSVPIIPTSVTTRRGLDELETEIWRAMARLTPPAPGKASLWVDRVFTQKGRGTVVTGSLMRGKLRGGDSLLALPSEAFVRVSGIQVRGEDTPWVGGPERVALLVSGKFQPGDLERGTLLAIPGSSRVTQGLLIAASWLGDDPLPARVRVAVGTEEVLARLRVAPDDNTRAFLHLDRAIGAFVGAPVLVRVHSPMTVLGGGVITKLDATRQDLRSEPPPSLLALIEAAPRGVSTEVLCRKLGQTPQQLGTEFEELRLAGKILSLAGIWVSQAALNQLLRELRTHLEALHASKPGQSGISRDLCLTPFVRDLPGKAGDRLLAVARQTKMLVERGSGFALAQFKVRLNPRQEALVTRLRETLDAAGANPPNPHELAKSLQLPQPTVVEGLTLGCDAGLLVALAEDVFITPETRQKLVNHVKKLLKNQEFSISEARDCLQSSRKFVVPFMEFCDQNGITRRVGDKRMFL